MEQERTLSYEEQITERLRSLYRRYGYSPFKMSKFEEYDLYAQNKDFLVSDNVITFTDRSGKLMALKPDVTLSIVRASRPGQAEPEKVYYNENVYRIARGSEGFRELLQTGLECIGPVDDYHIAEVLTLAAESLGLISEERVLVLSHLDAVTKALDAAQVSGETRQALLEAMRAKNLQGLVTICRTAGAASEGAAMLEALVKFSGAPRQVLAELEAFPLLAQERRSLAGLLDALEAAGHGEMLRLDFSVIPDLNYYAGIVFRGFVGGVPDSVLSGGQYDKLITKLGKSGGAIGFAVYLDLLERLGPEEGYDVDLVLLRDADADVLTLQQTVRTLTSQGLSVRVCRHIPEKLRYRQTARLQGKEVRILGTDSEYCPSEGQTGKSGL